MYNKGIYMEKINNLLSALVVGLKNKNAMSLTDGSVLSEDFFKDLLNKTCGYNFVNLNIEEKRNYPGIDLGDKGSRVCMQVTTENNATKIQDTIKKFEDNNGDDDYDTVLILVIGHKKRHSKNFEAKRITFDKKKHIWDILTVIRKIYALEPPDLADLCEFLDDSLQNFVAINPLELSESDICTILDALWKYIDNNLVIEKGPGRRYTLQLREEDFITKKNALNNAEVLFKREVSPNLKYAKKIETFLADPINDKHQRKYFEITDTLQKTYSEDTGKFKDIGNLFGFVFDEIVNYENRGEVDSSKLLILLHNMYFNCDIGNNPK